MRSPAVQPSDAVRDESARVARALYALLDLSKALSSEVSLEHLLTVIVEKASTVVDADRTSIFVYDPARKRLWTSVAQGLGRERIELSLDSGVAGHVATTLSVLNIADAYSDPHFNSEADRRTGYRTRSILCAPVVDSKGKLLGVIESFNKTSADQFDEHDESLMRALATHVAVALERAQVTEMVVESERLNQSLRLASEIQLRMLPPGTVDTAGAAFAIHAHVQPARLVGGDFYDFFWNDQRLYFCIGDVAGKGIGSALVMAVSRTLLRTHAALQDDPARIVAAVNARLHEETDPTMFVTAFCGFLDLSDGRLVYCNAGHDRPLILSPSRTLRTLDSKPGLALGILPRFVYSVQEDRLSPGETLLLYTDGVTEAANENEDLFTVARLRQTVQDARVQDPAGLVRAVLDDVQQFAGGAAQADDITLMGIQYRGMIATEISATFARDLAMLPKVFHFLDGLFVSANIDPKIRFPVELAVEEIFTNLVRHNRRSRTDIAIRMSLRGNELAVELTDFDAANFDVTTEIPLVDIHKPLQARTPGGLGIHLVKKLMDRVDYNYDDGVSTITLIKKLE